MRGVGWALAGVGIALLMTGVLPTALVALLEWLLEPLGVWGFMLAFAGFLALGWLLIEAVTR